MASGSTFNLSIVMSLTNKMRGKMNQIKSQFDALSDRVQHATNKFHKLYAAAQKAGSKMMAAGKKMTRSVTLPILAMGAAMVKSSLDINKGMADVASLLSGSGKSVNERILVLKKNVQDMAMKFGVSTSDLTKGLYDTVSALGDSADSMKILGITTKAAKAGASSTADAFRLLSAVTKGYGDTSKAAFKNAADLAFQTVKLGQTKFPELAQSMGMVVPFANTLKIKQKELFAVFATLTGVTGNASIVATQYRSVLGAMMKPTKDMTNAARQLGFQSASQMIKQKGLIQSLNMLKKITGDNSEAAAKLFGRKEALSLFFALTGKSADQYKKKLQALEKANGALDDAFKKQTTGIGSAVNLWERFKATIQVFAQRIGELLLPILQVLVKFLTKIVEWFQALPGPVKKVIIIFAAVVAAIGPVLVIVGAFIKVFAILKIAVIAFQVASAPLLIKFALIAAVILGIILVVKLLIKNWKKVKKVVMNAVKPWLKVLKPVWKGLKEGFKAAGKVIVGVFKEVLKVIGPILKVVIKLVELLGKVAAFLTSPMLNKKLLKKLEEKRQRKIADEKTRMYGRGRGAPPPGKSDITLRIQTDKGTSATVQRMKKSGNTRVNVFTPGFRGVGK